MPKAETAVTWRKRTDANHREIVQALRAIGWTVHDMSRVGRGFPDLIAMKHGRIELVEVKDGQKSLSRQTLTEDERAFYEKCITAGVQVRYVTSVEQAVAL